MNRLQSKRALVTGGGQGLGRAIVEELLSQGCDVAIHYHKERFPKVDRGRELSIAAKRGAESWRSARFSGVIYGICE